MHLNQNEWNEALIDIPQQDLIGMYCQKLMKHFMLFIISMVKQQSWTLILMLNKINLSQLLQKHIELR